MNKKNNINRGSSLDSLLKQEGLLNQFQAMAKRMNTSRTQLDRILEPKGQNMTLETLQRAA